MQPAEFDLSLYRGDTFRLQLRLWQDQAMSMAFVLTGATADSQIRNKAAGTIIVPMECTVTTPNVIDVILLSTDSINLPKRRGAWDLQVVNGDVFTPIFGDVSITEDITAAPTTVGTGATDVPVITVDLWADEDIWTNVVAADPTQLALPIAPAERRLMMVEEAPKDGTPYVRQDGKWIKLSAALHGEEI
jgi:hypothetical protein